LAPSTEWRSSALFPTFWPKGRKSGGIWTKTELGLRTVYVTNYSTRIRPTVTAPAHVVSRVSSLRLVDSPNISRLFCQCKRAAPPKKKITGDPATQGVYKSLIFHRRVPHMYQSKFVYCMFCITVSPSPRPSWFFLCINLLRHYQGDYVHVV